MSGNFTYGSTSNPDRINFSNIRADIKKEEFVNNNKTLNSIWDIIDVDGSGVLEQNELDLLQQNFEDSVNNDTHLSWNEGDNLLARYGNKDRQIDRNDLFRFLSKLSIQTKDSKVINYTSEEMNSMLSNKDTYKQAINLINEHNVLDLKSAGIFSSFLKSKLGEKELEKAKKLYVDKVNKELEKLAKKKGLTEEKIKECKNETPKGEIYIELRNAIIEKINIEKWTDELLAVAKAINIPENEIEAVKDDFYALRDLVNNKYGGSKYLQNGYNIVHMQNLLTHNYHDKLQQSIDERYEELGGDTRSDRTDVDFGNGKIDNPARQKTGNCWVHGAINSLAATENGRQYLENNIYKDSSKGLIAVHLPSAESYSLPKPKCDGIYIFTEKEIAEASERLSEGDGDVTAYCLAMELFLNEEAYTLYKKTTMEGDKPDAGYEILFGTIGEDMGHFLRRGLSYDEIITEFQENKNPVYIGLNGHAWNVAGVDDNGNLLIQESNLLENWEARSLKRYPKDINGAPTFILTKEMFEDITIYTASMTLNVFDENKQHADLANR